MAAVPRGTREASLALGATKFETIWRVVLPSACCPAILTGLILAMARAAGEVAPLMITGVVKLAPPLPLDGFFPFFHLDRKFMHLGFHIYDVGFQSPNVDAARPMVYMTTVLLLAHRAAAELDGDHHPQPPAQAAPGVRRMTTSGTRRRAEGAAMETVATERSLNFQLKPTRPASGTSGTHANPRARRAAAYADRRSAICRSATATRPRCPRSTSTSPSAGSPRSSAPRAAASRRCCAVSTA